MFGLATISRVLLTCFAIWPLWTNCACSPIISRAILNKSFKVLQQTADSEESQKHVRKCLKDTFYSGVRRDQKVYSQMGEDGIIEAAFRCLQTTDKYYVEFGVEDGSECTTRLLRERKGWTGLMMDGSHNNQSINLQKEYITSSNIVSLFQKHGVPQHFDFMTVDLDLNTFWVLQAVLAAGYRPRLLNVEVNRNFPAAFKAYAVVNRPSEVWTHGCYFGASPLAYTRLAQFFGYRPLVFDENAVNLFFVHTDSVGGSLTLSDGHGSVTSATRHAAGEAPHSTTTAALNHPVNIRSIHAGGSARTSTSMTSDILLDDDFNLQAAAWVLPSPWQGLRWPIHDGCSHMDWVHIPAHVNFSDALWDSGLTKVVLLESIQQQTSFADGSGAACGSTGGYPCHTIREFIPEDSKAKDGEMILVSNSWIGSWAWDSLNWTRFGIGLLGFAVLLIVGLRYIRQENSSSSTEAKSRFRSGALPL